MAAEPDERPPLYLDLENPVDLEKLADACGQLEAQRGRLVILDEIQRAPGFRLFGCVIRRLQQGRKPQLYY